MLLITNEKGSFPLYIQLKDLFLSYISNGTWLPGSGIPSEVKLAKELNVSQGTIRKAITELVEINVLVRRQGKGTFVTNHDDNRSLFHFFHIVSDIDEKALPECETLLCSRIPSSPRDAELLNLKTGAELMHIERIRKLNNQAAIVETILLPFELFENLGMLPIEELPETLYGLYETQFGIIIHRAEEKIRAISASKKDASLLNVDVGFPLMQIDRVAFTLEGRPVEIRISRCNTKNYHYQNMIF